MRLLDIECYLTSITSINGLKIQLQFPLEKHVSLSTSINFQTRKIFLKKRLMKLLKLRKMFIRPHMSRTSSKVQKNCKKVFQNIYQVTIELMSCKSLSLNIKNFEYQIGSIKIIQRKISSCLRQSLIEIKKEYSYFV